MNIVYLPYASVTIEYKSFSFQIKKIAYKNQRYFNLQASYNPKNSENGGEEGEVPVFKGILGETLKGDSKGFSRSHLHSDEVKESPKWNGDESRITVQDGLVGTKFEDNLFV